MIPKIKTKANLIKITINLFIYIMYYVYVI